MKVGVIGCGGMGITHCLSLKVLSEEIGLEIVALADVRPERLKQASETFPAAKLYESGDELLEKEKLDSVHICLPSYLHADYAVKAMQRGMHVLIEKPVCLTLEDGERLLREKEKNKVQVMVGQVVRSFPEYRYLKDVFESQKYGELKSLVMQRISGDVLWGYEDWFHDEQKSGSVVLDLHEHDIDFIRYMLGEPESVDVRATAFESGMINQINSTYEYSNAYVTAEGTWSNSSVVPFQAAYRANFENAVVCYDGKQNPSLSVYHKDGHIEQPVLEKEFDKTDNSAGINIANIGPYYDEIKYFYSCLETGNEITRAPLEEGIKSVELALHEWKAAKRYVKEKQN